MTTHDIPNRRRRSAFVVGASVALGLTASLLMQCSGDEATYPLAAEHSPAVCPAPIIL